MSILSQRLTRTVAIAALLGSLAVGASAFAAPLDSSTPPGPPSSTVDADSSGTVTNTTPDTSSMSPAMASPSGHQHMKKGHAVDPAADMQKHVEERIANLHSKLMITADQESAWNDVAQAMRDNEATIGALLQARHEDKSEMTAVDDLQSYQKIAQAHADGLQKVITSFSTLYSSMSDAQKKNADMIFGNYEGRGPHKGHHKKTAPSSN